MRSLRITAVRKRLGGDEARGEMRARARDGEARGVWGRVRGVEERVFAPCPCAASTPRALRRAPRPQQDGNEAQRGGAACGEPAEELPCRRLALERLDVPRLKRRETLLGTFSEPPRNRLDAARQLPLLLLERRRLRGPSSFAISSTVALSLSNTSPASLCSPTCSRRLPRGPSSLA